MVLAAGSHHGRWVRQRGTGFYPVGTALSCAEGSTCPPMGITRGQEPWSPLRCIQEMVLRCAPACKCLFFPLHLAGLFSVQGRSS